MKIKIQPREEVTQIVPAYAEGSSPQGWNVTFDEGLVWFNVKKDYVPAKGWKLSKDHLRELIDDLEEFYKAVEDLE